MPEAKPLSCPQALPPEDITSIYDMLSDEFWEEDLTDDAVMKQAATRFHHIANEYGLCRHGLNLPCCGFCAGPNLRAALMRRRIRVVQKPS